MVISGWRLLWEVGLAFLVLLGLPAESDLGSAFLDFEA